MDNLDLVQHMGLWGRKDTSDIKAITEVMKGTYERRDFKILPSETWLDIGLCVGSFAYYAGVKGAKVIGFEPYSLHQEIAKKNLVNLSNVTLLPIAVSDKEGEMTLSINSARGNTWRNSLLKEWRGGGKEPVKVELIDKYITEGVCLKIDCEGSELPILNRLLATGDIKKVKKVVFEYSWDILPETAPFMELIMRLNKTHKISGLTPKYMEKLSSLKNRPQSWFPACDKVFCVLRD